MWSDIIELYGFGDYGYIFHLSTMTDDTLPQFKKFLLTCQSLLKGENPQFLSLIRKRYDSCRDDVRNSRHMVELLDGTTAKMLADDKRLFVHLKSFTTQLKAWSSDAQGSSSSASSSSRKRKANDSNKGGLAKVSRLMEDSTSDGSDLEGKLHRALGSGSGSRGQSASPTTTGGASEHTPPHPPSLLAHPATTTTTSCSSRSQSPAVMESESGPAAAGCGRSQGPGSASRCSGGSPSTTVEESSVSSLPEDSTLSDRGSSSGVVVVAPSQPSSSGLSGPVVNKSSYREVSEAVQSSSSVEIKTGSDSDGDDGGVKTQSSSSPLHCNSLSTNGSKRDDHEDNYPTLRQCLTSALLDSVPKSVKRVALTQVPKTEDNDSKPSFSPFFRSQDNNVKPINNKLFPQVTGGSGSGALASGGLKIKSLGDAIHKLKDRLQSHSQQQSASASVSPNHPQSSSSTTMMNGRASDSDAKHNNRTLKSDNDHAHHHHTTTAVDGKHRAVNDRHKRADDGDHKHDGVDHSSCRHNEADGSRDGEKRRKPATVVRRGAEPQEAAGSSSSGQVKAGASTSQPGQEEGAGGEEEAATQLPAKERRQIRRLEKLLEKIRDEIERVRDKDLSLEELDAEDSAYIYEDRLQKKFVKVWDHLCKLQGQATSTGRPTERKFKYAGTRFPEINRKIEKFVNRPNVFPDFHDIRGIIKKVNTRCNLNLSVMQLNSISKETFMDVGEALQRRRKADFITTFHSQPTLQASAGQDPALFDDSLRRKLEENQVIGKNRLEGVIRKYTDLQLLGDPDDGDTGGPSTSSHKDSSKPNHRSKSPGDRPSHSGSKSPSCHRSKSPSVHRQSRSPSSHRRSHSPSHRSSRSPSSHHHHRSKSPSSHHHHHHQRSGSPSCCRSSPPQDHHHHHQRSNSPSHHHHRRQSRSPGDRRSRSPVSDRSKSPSSHHHHHHQSKKSPARHRSRSPLSSHHHHHHRTRSPQDSWSGSRSPVDQQSRSDGGDEDGERGEDVESTKSTACALRKAKVVLTDCMTGREEDEGDEEKHRPQEEGGDDVEDEDSPGAEDFPEEEEEEGEENDDDDGLNMIEMDIAEECHLLMGEEDSQDSGQWLADRPMTDTTSTRDWPELGMVRNKAGGWSSKKEQQQSDDDDDDNDDDGDDDDDDNDIVAWSSNHHHTTKHQKTTTTTTTTSLAKDSVDNVSSDVLIQRCDGGVVDGHARVSDQQEGSTPSSIKSSGVEEKEEPAPESRTQPDTNTDTVWLVEENEDSSEHQPPTTITTPTPLTQAGLGATGGDSSACVKTTSSSSSHSSSSKGEAGMSSLQAQSTPEVYEVTDTTLLTPTTGSGSGAGGVCGPPPVLIHGDSCEEPPVLNLIEVDENASSSNTPASVVIEEVEEPASVVIEEVEEEQPPAAAEDEPSVLIVEEGATASDNNKAAASSVLIQDQSSHIPASDVALVVIAGGEKTPAEEESSVLIDDDNKADNAKSSSVLIKEGNSPEQTTQSSVLIEDENETPDVVLDREKSGDLTDRRSVGGVVVEDNTNTDTHRTTASSDSCPHPVTGVVVDCTAGNDDPSQGTWFSSDIIEIDESFTSSQDGEKSASSSSTSSSRSVCLAKGSSASQGLCVNVDRKREKNVSKTCYFSSAAAAGKKEHCPVSTHQHHSGNSSNSNKSSNAHYHRHGKDNATTLTTPHHHHHQQQPLTTKRSTPNNTTTQKVKTSQLHVGQKSRTPVAINPDLRLPKCLEVNSDGSAPKAPTYYHPDKKVSLPYSKDSITIGSSDEEGDSGSQQGRARVRTKTHKSRPASSSSSSRARPSDDVIVLSDDD